jgi:aldose sugar dehydrogenase
VAAPVEGRGQPAAEEAARAGQEDLHQADRARRPNGSAAASFGVGRGSGLIGFGTISDAGRKNPARRAAATPPAGQVRTASRAGYVLLLAAGDNLRSPGWATIGRIRRRRTSMTQTGRSIAAAAALCAAAVFGNAAAAPKEVGTYRTEKATVRVTEIVGGLEHPWSLEFLPDGRFLVTERPGRLRIVSPDGQLSAPIGGVPKVHAAGQAGLLDVRLSPAFDTDRTIFLSYAEPAERGARTAVARGVLDGEALRDVQVIFRQVPAASGNNHWGSRLVFDRQGNLFVTLGDRFNLRDEAQDLSNHIGALVRIRPDGSVPRDNPFVGRDGARPETWSYGHRNVQGAALHPQTGQLWTHEHGPQGGDEVNLTLAGLNFGWPVVSHGREYGTGLRIGEGTEAPGIAPPLKVWSPSIAPSGMAFYTGERIPGWKGNLLVGALRAQLVSRLELDGDRVVHEERMLQDLKERIRDVRQGPDGSVYLLTDSRNGRLLRVAP